MTSKSRWLVLLISTPLVIVAAVGGLLGASQQTSAPQSFAHLRVFNDVLSLVLTSYVEKADVDKVMEGAMRGLADGLDPSSAYLSAEEVRAIETNTAPPAGDVGLVVSRQFYLRVIGVRDGSPAARSGIRTGDFIRAIDGKSTRDTSAFTGMRQLRGAPGSKVQLVVLRGSTSEPHNLELTREASKPELVTSKKLAGGEGYVRVVSFGTGAAAAIRRQIDVLRQGGASAAVIDLRGVADGAPEEGIAAARAFVQSGTLATLASKSATTPVVTSAASGDGAITTPLVVLTSNGTANAAELFASALSANHRADLVGEPTAGIAAAQHLVKLPENRGLWLTYARYLGSDGKPIHERGLRPTIAVESPTVAFGDAPPATDDALTKAVEHLHAKKAA
jgi:carboxyl-terminal processing protease